jgi:hypothetical protein
MARKRHQTLSGQMSEMGQKAKYSLRADVFRSGPESGLNSDIAPCLKSARLGHQATSLDHQVGAAEQ